MYLGRSATSDAALNKTTLYSVTSTALILLKYNLVSCQYMIVATFVNTRLWPAKKSNVVTKVLLDNIQLKIHQAGSSVVSITINTI